MAFLKATGLDDNLDARVDDGVDAALPLTVGDGPVPQYVEEKTSSQEVFEVRSDGPLLKMKFSVVKCQELLTILFGLSPLLSRSPSFSFFDNFLFFPLYLRFPCLLYF